MVGKKKLSGKQELKICQEYIGGSSRRKLGKKHSVSGPTIINIIKRHNIKPHDSRKYYHDFNFFDKIDNEEKAYWLGFLEADGHVSKRGNGISLALATKDRKMVGKFKEAINADNPISNRKRFNKEYEKWYFLTYIDVYSQQMKKALLKHRKDNYSSVPDNLKHHFIRGLFDGDGSISNTAIPAGAAFSMMIHISLIENIQQYLMKECNFNKTKFDKRYEMVWILRYGGRNQVKRFYDFLYEDATVWMERKRKVFEEIEANRP